MKRRVFVWILSLALIATMIPISASAASVDDYPYLTGNFNTDAVSNNPGSVVTLSVADNTRIDAITTYHWNNGQGKAPGTISIYEDDVKVGTWQAKGRTSSGVSNTMWDVFPNFYMTPGHSYEIKDSSPETWSWNAGTKGAGMMELRGKSGVSLPSGTTSGYQCSDWAKAEVAKADSYGLIPSSLSGADLTRPISRADFASVSLRIYQKMSGTTVPASGTNPFTDTSNSDILKAYSLGIVNGTSATTFSPSSNLTREQASTMLTRAYKKIVLPGWTLPTDANFQLKYTKPAAFADQGNISAYATDSVAFMASQNILKGVGNNKFDPKNSVTREQALAIAVRMADNLDITPQQGGQVTPVDPGTTPSGSSEGPAQGTLTNGDASITFTTTQKGQAVLTKDGNGYDLLLSEDMEGSVSVSFPAAAPESGMQNVVYLGVPYLDEKGNQGFEKFPLDTTYANGKVTATANLSEYANAVEDAAYAGETATGKRNYAKEFAQKQAKAVGSGVNVKTAVYFFYEMEYLITSNAGHFRIYIPKSRYSTQDAAVAGKLSQEDGKRIVEEMEGILSNYQGKYKIKRTSWPMKVILDGGEGGEFGSGRMILKIDNLKGYGRDLAASQSMYQTMAHELFHFVQREYTPVALSQSWFDEASAAYMSIQMGYARCGSWDTAMRSENYASDAEAQYQGITPMDIATLGWFDFLKAGYGRASFIDYLVKTFGNDFLKRYYEQGITLAGVQTEARLENLTGKSLGQLAEDFYDKLVTQDGVITSLLSTPSEIYQRSYLSAPDNSLDDVRTVWELTASKATESTVIKVPRYGAYFTVLGTEKLNPGAKSFTLSVPVGDCAARLIAIRSNDRTGQYKVQEVFKPDGSGKFKTLPMDGTMYLLMMVNTNGSWGWTVSETLNITYEKLSASGSYPANIDQVPYFFQGTARTWTNKPSTDQSASTANATCRLSQEGGDLNFVLTIPGQADKIYAGSKGFFNNQGYFRGVTSDGGYLYAQLEAGKIVDRTKGPKPTEEQMEEAQASPFGYYIEGDKTTNVIRIFWFDKFGHMNYFEGSGVNDNSWSYQAPINVN